MQSQDLELWNRRNVEFLTNSEHCMIINYTYTMAGYLFFPL